MTPNPSPFDRLRDPNPYDVLALPVTASTAEISKAFAAAMKRRAYPVDVIARSRKRLLDPHDRLLASYLRIDFAESEADPIVADTPDTEAVGAAEVDATPEVGCPAHLDGLSDLLAVDEHGILGFDQLLGHRMFES
jgi:hypothetical protein